MSNVKSANRWTVKEHSICPSPIRRATCPSPIRLFICFRLRKPHYPTVVFVRFCFSFFTINWLFSRESYRFMPCRFSISELDSLFLLDKNSSAWQQKFKNPFWHSYKRITEDGPSEMNSHKRF